MIASIQSSERVFRAICKSNGLVRVRARATVGSSETLVFESRVPAYSNPLPSSPFGSVIATASSHVWRKLPAAIERTLNPIALAAGSFIVLGQRTICNLGRMYPKASGCLQFLCFLRALRVCQDFARYGTNLLHYNPTLSFVPTNHAHKKAWSNEHVAHEKSVKGA